MMNKSTSSPPSASLRTLHEPLVARFQSRRREIAVGDAHHLSHMRVTNTRGRAARDDLLWRALPLMHASLLKTTLALLCSLWCTGAQPTAQCRAKAALNFTRVRSWWLNTAILCRRMRAEFEVLAPFSKAGLCYNLDARAPWGVLPCKLLL